MGDLQMLRKNLEQAKSDREKMLLLVMAMKEEDLAHTLMYLEKVVARKATL